ncbi:MAG: hypothetical protein ACKOYJ_05010 [Planctomycetia bacterium]
MTTHRCSRLFVIGAVGYGTILGATGLGCSRFTASDEARAESAPRTLMRLPTWIESFDDRGSKVPAATPQATAASPVAPQAPATITADPAVIATAGIDAKHDVELAIPSTPPSSAEGKPGRALVRSRDTSSVDANALLTAGWTDLVPGESVGPKPDDAIDVATAGKQRPQLGPEASVLAPSDATAPTQSEPSESPAAVPNAPENIATDITESPLEAEPFTEPEPNEPAPVARPIKASSDETPTLAIDPASFRGVLPGTTTRDEIEATWGKGEPFSREDGTNGLSWKVEPFDRIEVMLEGDIVGSVVIHLAEPTSVAELSKQLEISDLRTVSVFDESGVSIGEVFPERGVIFSLKPGTQAAQAVILEPLDPESFVLRAEAELTTNTALATADLHYAVEIDPTHLRALRLLLALRCEQGKWADALALARQAEATDPADIWTRLKHAGVLVTLEQIDAAREKVDAVLKQPGASPLVVAQAERMLGRIEMAAATPDYQKAVEHFGNAIRTSSPLVTNTSASVQKAARDVLLDAHLGTAQAISKGTWQQKSRVIPKWIDRSQAIVDEAAAEGEEKFALELQLCRGALTVAAGSGDSLDPLPWVKRLLQVRASLDGTETDPWRRRQIDWETGQALSDALVAAQKRGDADDMLDNSILTAAYIERGAEFRQLTALERKNVGDLMFRIGVLHGLQRGDHAAAVTWFDKALPLWDGNHVFARDGQLGQLGESLVSMAISYWQTNRRDDAVAISRKGVDLMVEAVDKRQMTEQALAVPYGNLSTMYAEQGDEASSNEYSELASRAEASGTIRK